MRKIIAGVDEVGRGSLIGPVYASAVILKKSINQKIKLTDVITSHHKSKPKVRIKNKPQYNFQVSISHEKNMAVGIVICELAK